MGRGPRLLAAFLVLAAIVEALPAAAAAAQPPAHDAERAADDDSFALPDGLLFGAGSSAIQTEGAWNTDGKSPSVMDKLLQLAANLPDDSPYKNMTNGMQHPDTAADSYHRWREDVAAAKELKVYRFSVSWPRVLPDGDASRPNAKGVDFYHNLIDALLEADIQPMITMHHSDLPYPVDQATGGWADPRIVDAFVEFADFLFKTYGGKVKLWTTVNEPNFYCMNFALISLPGSAPRRPGDDYKCVHHTNLAHMRTYRLYQDRYRDQQGKIGAAALAFWSRPNSTSYEDVQAAERANLFALGSVYHPLVHGDYPAAMRERVDRYSALEGLPESRLPRFTEEEKLLLKGSADFLCFNAYMGSLVVDATHAARPRYGTLKSDRDVAEVNGHTMTPGHFGGMFMQANPWVLREAPLWIRDNYNKSIMITENGWGDETSDPLDDGPRVGYHSEYLRELVRVVEEDKVDVMGYMVWSLLDSFEWSANYGRKFGLVHVDFEGGSLNRTLKKSAWFFKQIGETRRVANVAFRLKSAASGRVASTPTSVVAAAVLVLLAAQATR